MPELAPAALDGPIGDFVHEAAAHTEADPAALLISALVSFGVAVGPGPEVIAGNRPQRARLFAMVVAESASSPLTWALRNAWDGAPIERVTRRRRVVVEHHHVGVIAHATVDQIRSQLSLTDASVSLVNRFIYVVARRGKLRPDEGNVPRELTRRHGRALAEAVAVARASPGEMRRTPTADRRWRSIYEELADDDPDGLLGIVIARSARHVLRLALVYALADRSREIRPSHLESALPLWRFSRASAAAILGAPRSDDIAGRLLDALRAAGPAGMSLTEQAQLFGRNLPAATLARAREQLERDGLAVTAARTRTGSGRPPQVTQIVERSG